MADLYRDFVFTRCTTPVTTTDVSITVEDVSLFPSNALLAKSQFFIAFESSLSYPHTFEIMQLNSVNTGTKTLNVTRGQGGTTAQAHAIVTYIKGTLTSDMVRRARQGFQGATAPSPDSDVFVVGDRYFNTTENRYYAFTGKAGWFVDTFTRAASAVTMGNTEVVSTTAYNVAPQVAYNLPYTGTWNPLYGVWGINASGQAYYVSGAVGNVAATLLNVGGLDVDFSFDVFASTTAGSDYGLVFRGNADLTYGYYLQFNGTTATLYRINGGTFGTTSQTTTYTTNTAHTWRVTAVGNVITVYRDGTSVISYTEAVPAMLVATGNVSASLGMRIGNATGVSDASLYWDNFKATTPNNTAPNTPTPQGWAPTSAITNTSVDPMTFVQTQLASVEGAVMNVVQQLDDAIQADANVESTVLKHDIDIAAIYATMDDWLTVIQDHETRIASQSSVDTTIATQVDELTDTVALSNTSLVRTTNVDTTAAAGEFLIASAGGYGTTRTLNAAYDSFGSNMGGSPSTITFTTNATGMIVSFRGTWTYYSSTSTLDGVAQTEQTRFDGNSGQARLFTSTANIASGSHTLNFTGGGGANIYFAYAVGITNASPTGASYMSTTSTSGTITSAQNQIIVVYVQSNDGLITTPTATGLTFTKLSEQYSGNRNNSAIYYAVNTTGATSVTISSGASGFQGMVAGSFAGSGTVPAFTAIGLPTPTKNNSLQIMNIDAVAPVRVTGALAAGSPSTLTGQFSRGTFVADGTSWYGSITGPESGSVVTKTAAYTANYGETILANAAAAAFAITLPVAALNMMVVVKKTDSSTNAVTVTPAGAAKIDNANTFNLANQYDAVSLVSDGTNWWVT